LREEDGNIGTFMFFEKALENKTLIEYYNGYSSDKM